MLNNKLIPLFATGAPGLTRLLLAVSVNALLGADLALSILTDVAFVIALSMLFTLGFSILLMKDQSSKYDESVIIASYFSAFIGCLTLFILFETGLLNFLLPSLVFFVGLVGYQNFRHINLRLQKFRKICLFEIIIWFIFVSAILGLDFFESINALNVFYVLAFSFLIFSLFQLCTLCVRESNQKDIYSALQQGALIGATNLLSGGLLWVLPKISEMIFLVEQVAIIANLAFLLGLIGLLPRTILNRSLPLINTAINSRDVGIVKNLNSSLYRLLWLLLPISVTVSILYNLILDTVTSSFYTDFFLIILLACFCSIQSQRSLINSTVLTLLEKNKDTFIFNVYYILVIVFSLSLILILKESELFKSVLVYVFYFFMLIGITMRNLLLSKKTKCALEGL